MIDLSESNNYSKYQILCVDKQIKLKNYKYWKKYHDGELPSPLSRHMRSDQNDLSLEKRHTYNTRNKHVVYTPLALKQKYHASFLVCGLHDYNSLPLDIKIEPNYKKI